MVLIYLNSLSKYNEKYKSLLNVIDTFALCVERNSKGQNCYLNHSSFKILFKNRKTVTIDRFPKFVNATVQRCWRHQGVGFHTTYNPHINDAIVESFNRTLKKRCVNISLRKTHRYLDVINNILTVYKYPFRKCMP